MLEIGDGLWVDPLRVESVAVIGKVIRIDMTSDGADAVKLAQFHSLSLAAVKELGAKVAADVAAAKAGR